MDTARERFIQTMEFRPAHPPFVVPGWAWTETSTQWRQQGWDGRAMHVIFGADYYVDVSVNYGPSPGFAHQVIEEDEKTRLYVNHEGILMREFKEHSDTSMPQFIKFPVATEQDFGQLAAERLGLNLDQRLTPDWKERIAKTKDLPFPRRCWPGRWGGFFGPLRNFMGLEGLCIAFYEQPKLVERMMAQRAEIMIAVTEKIMEHTPIETFWFWEDMAYNHGSLINPTLFRRFALPHYRRVTEWVRSRGVKYIGLDSDGDISELIPLWLEAGINFLWPFEVEAGMDVVAVRREYGHALAMGGGIPKTAVAKGGDAMRQAVDRVMPLADDGGYIPELDHGAPPDISWSRYCEYMTYLTRRLERG